MMFKRNCCVAFLLGVIHLGQVLSRVNWDDVRSKQDENYEYYLSVRDELIHNSSYNSTWVIIANGEIIGNGPTYSSVNDRRDLEKGDIMVYVGDENRTVGMEEVLVIIDDPHSVVLAFGPDPTPDVNQVSEVQFETVLQQFELGSYDYDRPVKAFQRRLSLHAIIQKYENTKDGSKISFTFDTGSKQTFVNAEVWQQLEDSGFAVVGHPGVLIGYIGKNRVELHPSYGHMEAFNIFGMDIAQHFQVTFCVSLQQFSIRPLNSWYLPTYELQARKNRNKKVDADKGDADKGDAGKGDADELMTTTTIILSTIIIILITIIIYNNTK